MLEFSKHLRTTGATQSWTLRMQNKCSDRKSVLRPAHADTYHPGRPPRWKLNRITKQKEKPSSDGRIISLERLSEGVMGREIHHSLHPSVPVITFPPTPVQRAGASPRSFSTITQRGQGGAHRWASSPWSLSRQTLPATPPRTAKQRSHKEAISPTELPRCCYNATASLHYDDVVCMESVLQRSVWLHDIHAEIF